MHIILTWHHITKSNSCHGDETKIKRFEKGPIFIIGKQVASNAEKNGQAGQGQKGHDNIGPNARRGYGNMGCQVFKGGIQKKDRFLAKNHDIKRKLYFVNRYSAKQFKHWASF